MRRVRDISTAEHFRLEPMPGLPGACTPRRDSIEPEPPGTFVAFVFRVTGYDPDCDGSLMARLECVDADGESTGWTQNAIGLYPNDVVLDSPGELLALADAPLDRDHAIEVAARAAHAAYRAEHPRLHAPETCLPDEYGYYACNGCCDGLMREWDALTAAQQETFRASVRPIVDALLAVLR